MNLTDLFFKKLHDQMRIVGLVQSKPKKNIRLDPLDPEDLNIDLTVVKQWSNQNEELTHLILQNGMATFICNYEFIFQFYQSIIFKNKQIENINSSTLNFINLKILNLCQNNIKILQNIPQRCQQLYLDFNQINQINIKNKKNNQNLVLLSISYNMVTDILFSKICSTLKCLRCLNITANKIQNIRNFVQNLKKLSFIKILNCNRNPISILKIYYQYITSNIELKVIDNQKYVKPQPPKKQKQEVKPPQPPKQQKKDAKKDAKKGAKVQQKPVEVIVPIVQQKLIKPKQLTEQDFTVSKLNIAISNFQNFNGILYQSSIFCIQNINPKKCQTTYWLSYILFNKNEQTYEKRIQFDSLTSQNDQNRLDFATIIKEQFVINSNNLKLLQQGFIVYVYKQQPTVLIDSESGQPKPQIIDNQPVIKKELIGSVFVDLRQLYQSKNKKIQRKYGLWKQKTAAQPLFKDKYFDQKTQIQKRKQAFQEQIKKQEETLKKKIQQEQALKAQKKGKDSKKPVDKKLPAKKDGKQQPNQEKKKVQKCQFPPQQRKYVYLGGDSLTKVKKQLLAIKVWIQ